MKISMKAIAFAIVGILIVKISPVDCQGSSAAQCTKVDNTPPCVCSLNGKNIDLRSLANNDNTAKFKIEKASDNNAYSYNPCNAFTEGDCSEVAGCQDAGGNKRSIGIQDKATFSTDDNGGTTIAYTGGNEGRNMKVNLVCDKGRTTPDFQFVSEAVAYEYTFTLTTVCACPGGCDAKGPTGGGGNNNNGGGSSSSKSDKVGIYGIVILSVFFLAIVVYFVAGMIIMRVKYEKTGTDIIPNKAFWISLPFLVKDGVVFTFSPCVSFFNSRRGSGYSKV